MDYNPEELQKMLKDVQDKVEVSLAGEKKAPPTPPPAPTQGPEAAVPLAPSGPTPPTGSQTMAQTPAAVAPSAPAAGAPTQTKGQVIYVDDLATVPDGEIAVWGANMNNYGTGTATPGAGQAEAAVGREGWIGIPTKRSPNVFLKDSDLKDPKFSQLMDSQLRLIESALASGKDVYFPAQGIGTGRAALLKSAPAVYDKLDVRLQASGIFNDPKTRPQSATSPATAQGGAQTPPPGETPASVAPMPVSGESMPGDPAPEKMTTASTPSDGMPLVPREVLNSPEAIAAGLDENGFIHGGNSPIEGQIPAYDEWRANQSARAKYLSGESRPTLPAREGDKTEAWKKVASSSSADALPVPTELQAALVAESLSAPRDASAGDRIGKILERNQLEVRPDPQQPGAWVIKDTRGGKDVKTSRRGKAYVPESAVEKIHKLNSKAAAAALTEWKESPHMIMQKVMQTWVESVVGKWTNSKGKPVSAINDLKDETATNRGYRAVRRLGLHFLLNQLKPDQIGFWKNHREAVRQAFIDAGMSEESFDRASRQFIGGGSSEANLSSGVKEVSDRTARVVETIRAIIDDPSTMGGRRVLGNQNVAEVLHYMLYTIFKYDSEILSGEMEKVNAFDEKDWVEKELEKESPKDPDGKPREKVSFEAGDDSGRMRLTAGGRDQMLLGKSGQRRYAIDAAAPDMMDERWFQVDEEGLDLPAFQNLNHPEQNPRTGYYPSKASIGFQVSTDPTVNIDTAVPGGDPLQRSSTLEIRTAKAVQELLMLEATGESMIRKLDDKTMLVGDDIPYTRDSYKVVAAALNHRRMLNTSKIVLVAWPDRGSDGVTIRDSQELTVTGERTRYTREAGKIFALREGDPDIEILKNAGAKVTVPFELGDTVSYPEGLVRPGQLGSFIVDVDPVVHQAVRHTLPLRNTGGGTFQVAYFPESFEAEAKAKDLLIEVVADQGPGASTRMKIPGIRTLATGVDQLPMEGSIVDGYTYGDPYVENPELYAETTDRERRGYDRAVKDTRALQDATEAGVPKRDLPQVSEATQGDAEYAIGRYEGAAGSKPGYEATRTSGSATAADMILQRMNLSYLPDPRMVPEAYRITLGLILDGILSPESDMGLMLDAQAPSDSKIKNLKKIAVRRAFRNLVGMGEMLVGPDSFEKWLGSPDGQYVASSLRESFRKVAVDGEGSIAESDFIREFGLSDIKITELGPVAINADSPRYTGKWPRNTDYESYSVYDLMTPSEEMPKIKLAAEESSGKTSSGDTVSMFPTTDTPPIERPPLSERHQVMVDGLMEDLMVILRHRAMWSNFAGNGGLNARKDAIEATSAQLEEIFLQLQKRNLWDDATDSVLIREVPSGLTGSLPIDRSKVIDIFTTLPPDVKVSSGGFQGVSGIDKYLGYDADGTPEAPIVDRMYRAFVDLDTQEQANVRMIRPEDDGIQVNDVGDEMPDTGAVNDIVDSRQTDQGLKRYENALRRKFGGDRDALILGREMMSEIGSGAAKSFNEAAKIVQGMEAPEGYSGKIPWNTFVMQNYNAVEAAITEFARRGPGRKIVATTKPENIGTKANVTAAIKQMILEVKPERWDHVLNKVFEKWSLTLGRDVDGKSPMKAVNAGLYGDQYEVALDDYMEKHHMVRATNRILGKGASLPSPVMLKGKKIAGGQRELSYLEVEKLADDNFPNLPNRLNAAKDLIKYAKARGYTFVYTVGEGDKPVIVLTRVSTSIDKKRPVDQPIEIIADDSEFQTQVFTPDEMNDAIKKFGGEGIVKFVPSGDPDSPLFTVELSDVSSEYLNQVGLESPTTKAQTSMRRLLDAALLIRFRLIVNETLQTQGVKPKYVGSDLELLSVEKTMDGMELYGPFGSRYIPALLGGVTRAQVRDGSLTLEQASRLAEQQDSIKPGVDPILDEMRRLGKAPAYVPLDPATDAMSRRLKSAMKNNRLKLLGAGGGTALGAMIASTVIGAGVDTAVTKAQYGDKVASSNLPISLGLNAVSSVNPAAGVALMLGTGALTDQDMLRLAINMIAGFAGGAAGAAAGTFAGPVGTFAGATAGSTAASLASDAIYGAVTGNSNPQQQTIPANIAANNAGQGDTNPGMGITNPVVRNVEVDPLEKIKTLGIGG